MTARPSKAAFPPGWFNLVIARKVLSSPKVPSNHRQQALRVSGRFPAPIGSMQLAVSTGQVAGENTWMYAKRALARGDFPEEVIRRIADFRGSEKSDALLGTACLGKDEVAFNHASPCGKKKMILQNEPNEPEQVVENRTKAPLIAP